MLFHTWIFGLFFAFVYAVYLPLRRTRFWVHWLLAASYVFYGWWNPLYLLLIVYSTTLDYTVGRVLSFTRYRRIWLLFSVANNLFLLGFFKYGGFVAENLNLLLAKLDIAYALPKPDYLLPVGISFYVFQSMSYTIDRYRGEVPVEKNYVRFAAFVSLFPQLVAGPIERANHLLPQLASLPVIKPHYLSEGLSLFVVGLFKKLALADFLAMYVDPIYTAPQNFDTLSLVAATFAFAWQIYFDFSGYTDMARGVAKTMGIDLMLNFNNPYLADGLGDFWRRWHISLSTWFKDYVYIPLGGNRHGTFSTYKNMFLTMVISGVWHGAAWTFVIWGALHGLGRFLTRELERTTWYELRVPRLAKQLGVFVFVCFTWVFFRAASIDQALYIVGRIFKPVVEIFACLGQGRPGLMDVFHLGDLYLDDALGDPRFPLVALLFCAGIWFYQFLFESRLRPVLESRVVRMAGMLLMLLWLMFFTTTAIRPFIYFQF
ncbi:MAG: MBOAT family protein [Phycisphaerae bacterium]|nr:MBOAT family protein [Phycisphaerae bacterium]